MNFPRSETEENLVQYDQEQEQEQEQGQQNDVEEASSCFGNICHPSSRTHRYFVLIFMCFLGFGNFFSPFILYIHLFFIR